MSKLKQVVVIKSNELIKSTYSMSTIEQQIILYAIAKCREDNDVLSENYILEIDVTSFADLFGYSKKDNGIYGRLKDATERFFTRTFGFNTYIESSDSYDVVKFHWLSMHQYNDKLGTISLRFSPDVLPHITRLDGKIRSYTQYTIDNVCGLTFIATRIYEMLMQGAFIGKWPINIAELRTSLEIENKYPLYGDLKRRVIDPAVKQINDGSNVTVSYKEIKKGRSVTDLMFAIRYKNPTSDTPALTPEQTPTPPTPSSSPNPGETQEAYNLRLRREEDEKRRQLKNKPGFVSPKQLLKQQQQQQMEAERKKTNNSNPSF